MIICAGESLIDMLPRTTSANENAFAPYTGGAVLNTAIAVARLGSASAFISGVSNDLFGQQIVASMQASHVRDDLLIRSDRPTTLAFVRLVDGQATYAFYDEGTAGRMLDASDMPDIPDTCNALFFGGISLVVEPCASAYEALHAAQSDKRITMIDPNIRPSFIKDETAYRARLDRMLSASDVIKVSDEDLAWIFGGNDITANANKLLNKGVKIVCVTEGADGATAFFNSGSCHVAAKKVEVVDTVGAGDTFNAGFLSGLEGAGALSKEALASIGTDVVEQCLERAISAAAITVSRAGANPPYAHEL